MKEELKLVRIDSIYCNYLRKYDSKVPFNFDKKKQRPFIGVLFEGNNIKYFAPLSSPKQKHLKMRNSIDFLKIDKGNLGAVNFNNMLPVSDKNIKIIDLSKICRNSYEEKYQMMLKNQIFWLNRNKSRLYKKSLNLYNMFLNNKLDNCVRTRCCDFKLLEQQCLIYNEEKEKVSQ